MHYELLLYFQFFKFHILCFDTQSVGSGINLGASCCRQHLKLIWCRREGDIRIHQCRILRVCNRHAGCYGFSSSVLVTETKGILLSKTRGDDECGGITHRFSYNLFRLVDRSRACLCVLWQLFFRQFGNGVGVQCAPVDGNGFQLLGAIPHRMACPAFTSGKEMWSLPLTALAVTTRFSEPQ